MSFLKNQALWVALSAITLFWASDRILGTELNRDVVDWAAILFSLIMGTRLLPDAWDRFQRGGGAGRWQLLMSNVLFWYGFAAFCMWTLAVRGYDRPTWMVESPLNGFFKFWILGAAILSFFATSGAPAVLPPRRLYYVAVGVLFGILLGILVAKTVLA